MTARERLADTLRPIRRWARGVAAARLPAPRFRVFGVGMAKSGTHSVAALFATHYRAAHEPEADEWIDAILGRNAGRLDDDAIDAALRRMDGRLRLEVNASLLNGFVVDRLVRVFPDARFVLTVREPRVWLDSMINQQLSRPCPTRWRRLRDLRFGTPAEHPPAELPLAERGLYTLDGYFAHWAAHNRRVLDAVPPARRIVIGTHAIAEAVPRLASFLDVDPATLDAGAAHAFPAAAHHGVLDDLDPAILARAIERHCAPVIESSAELRAALAG